MVRKIKYYCVFYKLILPPDLHGNKKRPLVCFEFIRGSTEKWILRQKLWHVEHKVDLEVEMLFYKKVSEKQYNLYQKNR